MGRTPSNTDEKLIQAGVALARAKGLNGYTVRDVCARSRVNLGMFHYYFKTREKFNAAVLGALYGPLIDDMSVGAAAGRSARENVEALLTAVYHFARKNRRFLSLLFGDALAGDRQTVSLVGRLSMRHFSMLEAELERARRQGLLRAPSVRDAMLILVPHVPLPQVMAGLAERLGVAASAGLRRFTAQAAGEEETHRRVRFLLDLLIEGEK